MIPDIEFSVDITTLYDMLEEHNWHYWDDKDHNVYEEGAAWWAIIQKHADTPEKKRLVADYEKHIQTGSEKPERPEP